MLFENLLNGMGAIGEKVTFGNVYQQLQVGELDAAVSCSSCGADLNWYNVAGYLVGPLPALGHSWITISSQKW